MRVHALLFTTGVAALACSAPAADAARLAGTVQPAETPRIMAPSSAAMASASAPPIEKPKPTVLDPRSGERLCLIYKRYEGKKDAPVHIGTWWTFRDDKGRTLRIVQSQYPMVDEPGGDMYEVIWDKTNRITKFIGTFTSGRELTVHLAYEEHGAVRSMRGQDPSEALTYQGKWLSSKTAAPNAAIVPEEDKWFGSLSHSPQTWLPFTGTVTNQRGDRKSTERYDDKGYWIGGAIASEGYESKQEIIRAKDGRITERRHSRVSNGKKESWTLVYTYDNDRMVKVLDKSNGNIWRYTYADDGRLASSTFETKTDIGELKYEYSCAEPALSGDGF